jgi:hypothetical protein
MDVKCIIKKCGEQLSIHKFSSSDEMYQFIKRQKLTKTIKGETDKLNGPKKLRNFLVTF